MEPGSETTPAFDARSRVLVVDDHHMFAESLVRWIEEEADLECVGAAHTLGQAREMARRHQPDVVVLDQHLPDGTGVSLVPELKALEPTPRVVMLTSSNAEPLLMQAVDEGVSGFVLKSRPIAELISAIRAALADEIVISPEMVALLVPRLGRSRRSRLDFSPREVEVLKCVAEGLTNAQVAHELSISVHTVRNHVANMCQRLGVHSKLSLVAEGHRHGLLGPPGG